MSRRLGVALLGAGLAGRMHSAEYGRAAGLLADRGIRLEPVVVADADLDRARSRSAIPAVEADWRAAVDRDDVDLVDICLPDECHAEVAIAAARAGKHILCEKPLAQTPAQGEAALAEVERAGVCAMVGLQYRRTPAAELLGQLIDDGRLGRPHTVRAYFARDLGADPATRVGWRFDGARLGPGSVHALGPNVIDLLRYLVGEITAVAASVQSDAGTDGRASDSAPARGRSRWVLSSRPRGQALPDGRPATLVRTTLVRTGLPLGQSDRRGTLGVTC